MAVRGKGISLDDGISRINALDRPRFVARLGPLFEGSPWVAERAWRSRPFAGREALHATLCAEVRLADRAEQLALIRAHPDLVGRAALAGTLTRESTAEQRTAGLDPDSLSPAEIHAFAELNGRYQARFGFPFVICARENKKASILAGLRARLENDAETEIATALAEIDRIAWHRLTALGFEP